MTRNGESGNGVDGRRPGAKPKAKPSAKPGSRARAKPRLPRSRWTPKEIETAFARWQAAEPAPRSDLEYSNAFTLLVAVVLSAQATDAGVNKATRGLFAVADNAADMLALGEDAVREHIKTIGLFRNKAKNVILLSETLVTHHDGAVPAERDALQSLAGVGRKTANVVLNIAFGHPEIAVDTHIFRVANRTGMAPGKDP
ncbi:MAG: endonuclease III, partial [Pseudomonadota bacterium]